MKKTILAAALALLIGAGTLTALPVAAGRSEVGVVSEASLEGGIDGGTWVVSGKVTGEDDCMVFGEETSPTAKVTAMTKVGDYTRYGIENIFTAVFTINIESIPAQSGNRLAFAFGLSRVSATLGSDGVTEIYFMQDTQGLKMGITRYAQDTADKTIKSISVVPAQTVSGLTPYLDFTVSVTLNAAGQLIVTGQAEGSDTAATLCDASTPNNGGYSKEGFICFGQNGRSIARISAVRVLAYSYENMTTPLEMTENFDNGHYNVDAWYSRSDPSKYSPGGVYVENNALVFHNAANAVFGTRYSYSNFEMTFDLLDVQRSDEYDENNNLIAPKTEWLGISLGNIAYNSIFDLSAGSEFMFSMEPSGRRVLYDNLKPVEILGWNDGYKDNFWSEENEGQVYNFRISMIDGLFTVYYKRQGDAQFPAEPFYEKQIAYTPSGYVRLIAYEPAGFVFDNIRMVNKDAEPVPVELTYTENSMPGTEDAVYTDTWDDADLIANRLDGSGTGGGCSSSAAPVGGAAAAICCAGAAAVLVRRKQR